MSFKEKFKRNIPRAIIGIVIGAAAGFAMSYMSQSMGSQCTIMCNWPIAMAYMGFVGLIVAVK